MGVIFTQKEEQRTLAEAFFLALLALATLSLNTAARSVTSGECCASHQQEALSRSHLAKLAAGKSCSARTCRRRSPSFCLPFGKHVLRALDEMDTRDKSKRAFARFILYSCLIYKHAF